MTHLSNTSNQQASSPMPFGRYTPFVPVDVPDRTWPTKKVEKAPAKKAAPKAEEKAPVNKKPAAKKPAAKK